jgi:sodium transport system permease protein
MQLNLPVIATLFRAELRMVLRDRRILVTSIILPLLVTPLMFLGSNWSLQRRQKQLQTLSYHYTVTGPRQEELRSLVAFAKTLPGSDSRPEEKRRARRASGRRSARTAGILQFDEVPCTNPLAALAKGEIHLVLQGDYKAQSAFDTVQKNSSPATNTIPEIKDDESEASPAGVPLIRLIYRADRDESAAAQSQMQEGLREARKARREELLKAHGFPLSVEQLAVSKEVDLASKKQVAGLTLGRSLTFLLLLFILPSGAVVAMDSLAGEKERGTLETLLTTSVQRRDILVAKGLVIVMVALIITLIQTGNLLVYAGLKLLPVPAELAAVVTPSVAVLLFILYLPMAALAANVLLLISGYARTYKEAQMYFLPVLLIGFLPALTPFLPGVTLRSIVVLVPIANLALAAKEILVGSFDWPFIFLSWSVTGATAWWVTRRGLRVLSAERLIFAGDTDAAVFTGGFALFERQVWIWFSVLWAGLLIVGNYMEKSDLRVQILINLLVVLFGASCLMLRHYRLDPETALALRAPKPAVWLGVLIAVPGGLLSALGLFRLANLVLPVSTKMTESFNEAVFPPGIPIVQLVFFLTVLPGVFEEIAFRGLLLHAWHRRLRPAALALAVGVAFGIYHMTLFRFVPTTCLGIMFAAVTLLTGSILPAMLWHCLSNAAGILTFKLQIPETELNLTCYATGAGLLAVAFWIFWRNRTPYPGLRVQGRSKTI